MLSGSIYALDLVLAHQLLLAWGVFACLLIGAAIRRWRWTALMMLMLVLALWPVVRGRTVSMPRIDFANKDTGVIRVITCNINPRNEGWEEDLDALMGLDADAIVLIEVPVQLSLGTRRRGWLDGTTYPQWLHRSWVDEQTSPGFILSRWPMEQFDSGPDAHSIQHVLHARVRTPAGDVVVGLLHPLSPRSNARWRQGNAAVETQTAAAARTLADTGLPLVIGADLNSTPAQWRARRLYKSGLRMSKPLLRVGGSFPAGRGVPEVMMIQLDDVWHAGAIRPIAWATIDLRGSDHRAVCVDFVLEPAE